MFNRSIPEPVQAAATDYFFAQVLAFLQPQYLSDRRASLFPENNKIYLAAIGSNKSKSQELIIVNVPSDTLPRFHMLSGMNLNAYISFSRRHYPLQPATGGMPPGNHRSLLQFQVTRDAALDLADEYEGDLARQNRKQIAKRDFGFRSPACFTERAHHRNACRH